MPPAYLRGPQRVALPYKPGCTGKAAYQSRADVMKVVESRKRDIKLDVYQCKHCGDWHLTSQGKISALQHFGYSDG